ncbi:MAG: lipo-like protein [Methylobacteriaceae bacterium]|nr:lipo-like protein [Methylobacteriaceae bacterium]
MFGAIAHFVGRRLEAFLAAPIKGFTPLTTGDPQALARCIRPADVLLIEGSARISTAIKYLTQSTWSHAALHVGPIPGRREPDGEPHVLIEALLGPGVVSAPLSRYARFHTRICRPVGLSRKDAEAVAAFAISRIGKGYDARNVVDLARYLLPTPPVPVRFRRRMIALGAGSPTRTICSTLIAQAFGAVRFPILPRIETVDAKAGIEGANALRHEIFHIRHYSLYTPRDFDISPYFAIVKPTIEMGFDYQGIEWARDENAAAPDPAA